VQVSELVPCQSPYPRRLPLLSISLQSQPKSQMIHSLSQFPGAPARTQNASAVRGMPFSARIVLPPAGPSCGSTAAPAPVATGEVVSFEAGGGDGGIGADESEGGCHGDQGQQEAEGQRGAVFGAAPGDGPATTVAGVWCSRLLKNAGRYTGLLKPNVNSCALPDQMLGTGVTNFRRCCGGTARLSRSTTAPRTGPAWQLRPAGASIEGCWLALAATQYLPRRRRRPL
jgi:hypothetical protein